MVTGAAKKVTNFLILDFKVENLPQELHSIPVPKTKTRTRTKPQTPSSEPWHNSLIYSSSHPLTLEEFRYSRLHVACRLPTWQNLLK